MAKRKTADAAKEGVPAILAGIEKAATTLASAIKRDRPSSSAASQLALIDLLNNRGAELDGMIRLLLEHRAVVEQRASVEYLELESRLRESFAQRGLSVDGQWPTLYVERAIEVKADDATRSLSVDGRDVGSQPATIVATVASVAADLIPADFNPEMFLRQLAEAYDDLQRQSSQLPIWDVYRSFVVRHQGSKFWRDVKRERFIPVTANQFRARLSRLLAAEAIHLADGRQLRLLPPLNPKDAMYIYQPAEGRFGYVGRLEFMGGAT